MKPIYTANNGAPAYELRWSLALFPLCKLPSADGWVAGLQAAVERDGVRILEECTEDPSVSFLLLSTKPPVQPSSVVKSVEGRLQHLIRETHPKAIKRNFCLTSAGDVRREVIESYGPLNQQLSALATRKCVRGPTRPPSGLSGLSGWKQRFPAKPWQHHRCSGPHELVSWVKKVAREELIHHSGNLDGALFARVGLRIGRKSLAAI